MPSTDFSAAAKSLAVKSFSFNSAICRTCARVTLPTLFLPGSSNPFPARRLLQQDRGRRGLRHEGERPVRIDRDDYRSDHPLLGLSRGIEGLAKLHDIDATLAQRWTHGRAWIGCPAGICSFTSPIIFFAISWPFDLVPLNLDEFQLHRSSSSENTDEHSELPLLRADFFNNAVEICKRTVDNFHILTNRE